jgi:carbon starvation protein
MSLSLLALVTIGALILGYTFYGRFIADQFRLDDLATTPAVARNDGIDFVPTRPFYLLGQHFSAIAAAGPIAGPSSPPSVRLAALPPLDPSAS